MFVLLAYHCFPLQFYAIIHYLGAKESLSFGDPFVRLVATEMGQQTSSWDIDVLLDGKWLFNEYRVAVQRGRMVPRHRGRAVWRLCVDGVQCSIGESIMIGQCFPHRCLTAQLPNTIGTTKLIQDTADASMLEQRGGGNSVPCGEVICGVVVVGAFVLA